MKKYKEIREGNGETNNSAVQFSSMDNKQIKRFRSDVKDINRVIKDARNVGDMAQALTFASNTITSWKKQFQASDTR
tara:strand:+ start:370 stop:600 length:231 start_codon:yes stop_codon:yes gene_type:complete